MNSNCQINFSQNVIDNIRKKSEEEPIYLVVGGYLDPYTNTRGRHFFERENVFILDTMNLLENNPFRDRYIQLDLKDIKCLRKLAEQVSELFDAVVFDWSTYKFIWHLEIKDDIIDNLLRLLKDGGKLYISGAKTYDFKFSDDEIRNKQKNGEELNKTKLRLKKEITEREYKSLLNIFKTQRNNYFISLNTRPFVTLELVNSRNRIDDAIVKQIYTEGLTQDPEILIVRKGINQNNNDRNTIINDERNNIINNNEGGGLKKQPRTRRSKASKRKSKRTRRH